MATLIIAAALVAAATADPVRADESDALFYSETGFGVWNPEIRAYFESRGGIDTFGFPISNVFTLQGFEVQLFQRQGVQIGPSGSPRMLDILESIYLDHWDFGGLTIPQVDNDLIAAAPTVGSPDYAVAVRAFIRAHVPDSWQGRDIGFLRKYLSAAPPETPSHLRESAALEFWGFPRSRPMPDPTNANHIYQRFQRGVMHYSGRPAPRVVCSLAITSSR